MFFKKLNECGYEEALLGLSLSFYDHNIPLVDWDYFNTTNGAKYALGNARDNSLEDTHFWTNEKYERAIQRSKALAGKGGGHDKFLRSIVVWAYIQAPRSFWSEFDTYQVGMTKNSSSTMHTLDKRRTNANDYGSSTSLDTIHVFNDILSEYKNPGHPCYKDIARLKENLPEGWLQERQICTNYEVLRNIINQRSKHRLWYWKYLCTEILNQVDHPELLCQNN